MARKKIFEAIMAGRETQTHRSKKLREQQEKCIITLKTLTYHIQTGKTNKQKRKRDNLEGKEKKRH